MSKNTLKTLKMLQKHFVVDMEYLKLIRTLEKIIVLDIVKKNPYLLKSEP